MDETWFGAFFVMAVCWAFADVYSRLREIDNSLEQIENRLKKTIESTEEIKGEISHLEIRVAMNGAS